MGMSTPLSPSASKSLWTQNLHVNLLTCKCPLFGMRLIIILMCVESLMGFTLKCDYQNLKDSCLWSTNFIVCSLVSVKYIFKIVKLIYNHPAFVFGLMFFWDRIQPDQWRSFFMLRSVHPCQNYFPCIFNFSCRETVSMITKERIVIFGMLHVCILLQCLNDSGIFFSDLVFISVYILHRHHVMMNQM